MSVKIATAYSALLALAVSVNAKFKSQAKGEADSVYLTRLVEVVAESDEDSFNALPADAQSWFNDAGTAINAEEAPPAPEGFESVADQEADKPAGKVALKGKTEKAAKAPKAPKGKVAKEPKAPKVKKDTATGLIYAAIARNPNVTIAEIAAMVKEKNGVAPAAMTISVSRRSALLTLRAVKEAGFWSGPDFD